MLGDLHIAARTTGPQDDMTFFPADFEQTELAALRAEVYFAERPLIAEISQVAAVLMEIVGPMLWAALILMCLWAELYLW